MTGGLSVDAWLWGWQLRRREEAVAVGALTLAAVLCYACSKLSKMATLAHALAHAWVTAAHVLLLWYL